MQLDHELHFGAAPGAVAAMLADPEFVHWAAARSTAGNIEAADVLGGVEDGFVVTVRRIIPIDQMIASVRPLARRALEIRQTEAWEPADRGRRRGTASYEITGVPVRVLGTLLMQADGPERTRVGFSGTVAASVPVVGAALERAMAQRVRGLLTETESAGRQWLAR